MESSDIAFRSGQIERILVVERRKQVTRTARQVYKIHREDDGTISRIRQNELEKNATAD